VVAHPLLDLRIQRLRDFRGHAVQVARADLDLNPPPERLRNRNCVEALNSSLGSELRRALNMLGLKRAEPFEVRRVRAAGHGAHRPPVDRRRSRSDTC
jgi:hypothetical protein